MWKLYQKNQLDFSLLWIGIYCLISIPLRGRLGDESIFMLLGLGAIALGLIAFILSHGLGKELGLDHWPRQGKRLFYLLPLWVLATGNLWWGICPSYEGRSQIYAMASMALIGFIEEVIFRGFLFRALLKRNGTTKAVIISALTFGIGHIVNLLAGQASLETFLQVLFAISWGFLFTLAYDKGGSLLPPILIHSLVDVFSKLAPAASGSMAEMTYVIATIAVALVYCPYLARLPREEA